MSDKKGGSHARRVTAPLWAESKLPQKCRSIKATFLMPRNYESGAHTEKIKVGLRQDRKIGEVLGTWEGRGPLSLESG